MLFAQAVNQYGVTPEQVGTFLFAMASVVAIAVMIMVGVNQLRAFNSKPKPGEEFVTRIELRDTLDREVVPLHKKLDEVLRAVHIMMGQRHIITPDDGDKVNNGNR